jgi:3'(2'), 5'-bisphosphate nucleotidase
MEVDELWSVLGTALVDALAQHRRRLSSLAVTEKPDRTLLTDADLAIEAMIVERLREIDPDARIIAEESVNGSWRPTEHEVPSRVWVIDPIDGTAEFVRREGREFCSVVCLLEHGRPTTALVVAPELSSDRSPVVMTATCATCSVTVNGDPGRPNPTTGPVHAASVTRSVRSAPPPFERVMAEAGYVLKTRTTSQTLDMVRTALDLSSVVAGSPRFDLFFRPKQKVWDGVAGLCFGAAVGLAQADLSGNPRVPVRADVLAQDEPTFDATVMGLPEAVEWFVKIAR